MNSPMRVVCEGCLRSIELDSTLSPDEQFTCPSCGYRMEHRSSGAVSSDANTRVQPDPEASHAADTPETIDWAATWDRGTLGTVGRFHLRERLGDGGFGQVYLAYDARLDRDVALKVLRQPDPSDRVMERFFREARAVARLDHPNIVGVHDAGFDDGRCWVAYQFVSGRPLWWYRDRQRMDVTTAARIIRDLADALGHAHAMGVVHRDMKPGNVIIDDGGRPRLIDFGLARRSDVGSDLTRDGVVVGTPAYMSPEQAGGMSKQADERSDVYSLGVMFYELLCGRRPHEPRTNATEVGGPPVLIPSRIPRARTCNAAVPAPLDEICARALSPLPEDRYPSARALAEAVDAWLNRRRSTGHGRLLGAMAALIVLTIANLAFSVPRLIGKDRPASAPGPVSKESAASSPIPGGSAERAEPLHPRPGAVRLIGNTSSKSKRYHTTTCPSVRSISPSNRIELASPEEAFSLGLKACEHCQPPGPKTAPAYADGRDSRPRSDTTD